MNPLRKYAVNGFYGNIRCFHVDLVFINAIRGQIIEHSQKGPRAKTTY